LNSIAFWICSNRFYIAFQIKLINRCNLSVLKGKVAERKGCHAAAAETGDPGSGEEFPEQVIDEEPVAEGG